MARASVCSAPRGRDHLRVCALPSLPQDVRIRRCQVGRRDLTGDLLIPTAAVVAASVFEGEGKALEGLPVERDGVAGHHRIAHRYDGAEGEDAVRPGGQGSGGKTGLQPPSRALKPSAQASAGTPTGTQLPSDSSSSVSAQVGSSTGAGVSVSASARRLAMKKAVAAQPKAKPQSRRGACQ